MKYVWAPLKWVYAAVVSQLIEELMYLAIRERTWMILGSIAAIILMSTIAAGCSAEDPSSNATTPESEPSNPEYAIHMVVTTTGQAPDPGEIAAEPWKHAESMTEYWIAEGDPWYRSTHERFASIGSTETVYRQEELVKDDVWYVLQGNSPEPDNPVPGWFNLLEYDGPGRTAEEQKYPDGLPDEPLISGKADFYRDALESGEATIIAEGSIDGTETYRLVLEQHLSWDEERGKTLTVDVRQTDYLPMAMLREEWSYGPPANPGERHVYQRRYMAYPTIEIVAWDDVPADAFELTIPDDTPRIVNRHMSIDEAVSPADPPVWWVGEQRELFEMTEDPIISSSGTMLGGFFFSPNDVGYADQARPLVSKATTEVVVHYEGPDETDLKISSIPWVDLADSEELAERESYWKDTDAVEHLDIAGRDAILLRSYVTWSSGMLSGRAGTPDTTPTGEGAGQQTYFHLIIDMSDSTVIVQGWKIPESEVIAHRRGTRTNP